MKSIRTALTIVACLGTLGLLTGCQSTVGGQTLPSAFYLDDDVQYFPAGPETRLPELRKRLEELKPPDPESAVPVDASGELRGTGDPQLDGPFDDAIDLAQRLAKSERVRQSFVRHTFRYWMGRNETFEDSPTLIAADRAYTEGSGSFKDLLVSLLTSDSFLYRKD